MYYVIYFTAFVIASVVFGIVAHFILNVEILPMMHPEGFKMVPFHEVIVYSTIVLLFLFVVFSTRIQSRKLKRWMNDRDEYIDNIVPEEYRKK